MTAIPVGVPLRHRHSRNRFTVRKVLAQHVVTDDGFANRYMLERDIADGLYDVGEAALREATDGQGRAGAGVRGAVRRDDRRARAQDPGVVPGGVELGRRADHPDGVRVRPRAQRLVVEPEPVVAKVRRVVVCGDREWSKRQPVVRRLSALPEGVTVITGGARGADTIAHNVAVEFGFKTRVVEAHWSHGSRCKPDCREVVGAAAGPIRNRKMLDLKPDLVIAFHARIDESKGTRDCLLEAARRGIAVELLKS